MLNNVVIIMIKKNDGGLYYAYDVVRYDVYSSSFVYFLSLLMIKVNKVYYHYLF